MRLAEFDFDLPEERIALRPAQPRDSARLLVVRPSAALEDRAVRDLPELLEPGDVIVFNDTRVFPARLHGVRFRDGSAVVVEATLHRRIAPDRWAAFARPGKRLREGDRLMFRPACDPGSVGDAVRDPGALAPAPGFRPFAPLRSGRDDGGLGATVDAKGEGGEVTLAFDRSGAELDEAIAEHGLTPLPPYIAAKRVEDERDRRDYQTVFARVDGSVAAPTAGLHFTPELLARLRYRGVQHRFVTLHVGAGTFLPVKADEVAEHRMHPEYGEVSAETAAAITAARGAGGRLVCVGTTSLRLIESAAGPDGTVRPFAGETSIFITPGYRFRAADALMTNFHLPRSTLFMLVCAFAGRATMRAAYAHAIERRYRFYSYGDACLLSPDEAGAGR